MKNERLIKIRGSDTRPEFARRVGVHKNTVARYENGVREPDGGYLRRLAEMGWNPLWILTGSGNERLLGNERDTMLITLGDPSNPEVQAAEERRSYAITNFSAGVASTIAEPQPMSHDLDQRALIEVLEFVEMALQDRRLTPGLHAELIGLVYAVRITTGKLPTASITRLVRAASTGESSNERQDQQDSRNPARRRGAEGGEG
jgi:transcriptional regulator with XRE-family HTH domain